MTAQAWLCVRNISRFLTPTLGWCLQLAPVAQARHFTNVTNVSLFGKFYIKSVPCLLGGHTLDIPFDKKKMF
jgi:hypothetical protein